MKPSGEQYAALRSIPLKHDTNRTTHNSGVCTDKARGEYGEAGKPCGVCIRDRFGICDPVGHHFLQPLRLTLLNEPPLAERLEAHEQWVREVRLPAEKASEGLRAIHVQGAKADYEIAQLPDGRFAITFHCTYSTGDMQGYGCPWTAYQTREKCLEVFLEAARNHFSTAKTFHLQAEAQREMSNLLMPGLFFVEPNPTPF